MKGYAIRALARGVVLESVRRKDLWVVAILGFLIMAAAGALGMFGAKGLEIFVKDLAVTVLGFFSTGVAVLTACRLVPDEIRNRTLYPLLARPITRLDFLIGKYLGAVVVTWIGFLALTTLTGIALATFGVHFEVIMLQYVIAKMMGLALVCAVGICLSTLMTPNAAATLTLLITFGSSLISRALLMVASDEQWKAMLFKILNATLPQTHLFDLGGRAVYMNWSPVPLWVMLALAAYLALYGAAMLAISWLKFQRQPL